MAKKLSLSLIVSALFALLLSVSIPAAAHHKAGHENGGGKASGSGSTVTEDNDTNDGGTPNNVPDDGDNMHPSGKDKSVENGNSGNQGNSSSHPDDSKGPMRYEGELGADKPGGPGGTDLADQDGNNGCGNDDDFDDDNNGWCGKPTENEVVTDVEVEEEVVNRPKTKLRKQTAKEKAPAEVLGLQVEAQPSVEVAAAPAEVAAQRADRGGVLPFTGGALVPFAVTALAMIGSGVAVVRRVR